MSIQQYLSTYRVERRQSVNIWWRVLYVFLAILAALIVTALLMKLAGAQVSDGLTALFNGGFGSFRALTETLVRSSPYILTGLAVAISFRGKVWNIGAEGQLIVGALGAYWASITFTSLPPALMIIVVLLFAVIGGMLCGFIPAYLRVKLKVDEIIVTLMMNYIVLYLLSFMVSGPWKDPDSGYQMSPFVIEAARLPILIEGTRLHIGFLVALIIAPIVYLIVFKTPFGYELRAIGLNRKASTFRGVNLSKITFVTMLISAGIAGLAGAGELLGLQHRLRMEMFRGDGYTGIIVAILAGLHPLGVIPVAIFFGGLSNGATRMQVLTGVPTALISAVEAIMMLFLLIAQVFSNYEIKRVRDGQ